MKTALVYDDVYLSHKTPPGYPERPERLQAIMKRLKAKKLLGRLDLLKAAAAPLRWIETVHSPEYVERVRRACGDGKKFLDSRDVPISADSYKAAVAAAGGVLGAVDAVMARKVSNAFCAVRPPGHHALRNKAMGFCIFNNVAIAARYIRQKYKLARVLIVDWDVHHGNSTEAAFYDDGGVMYFSVHRDQFYPGTGREADKGAGKGAGLNINVPLPAGAGDEAFLKAFKDKLIPPAVKFRPDFILISAGFDAHASDPLGGMKVSAAGFAQMTRLVKQLADKCCSGRIVSVLEGGYDLEGLSDCVEAHLEELMAK
ncbi:MAG: histone deacetylase [Planctomycetes bacterium]|nr:histone deacetylase [Planctomycetota bacterium]